MTTLYLVRHGATAANLERPSKLQGRRHDPDLDAIGIRQAEATRGLLIGVPFAACYSSPLRRAVETATLIAGYRPTRIDGLTECDVGRWEGRDWETVRREEPDAYARYMADAAAFGYPDGESFADVYDRAWPALERIAAHHAGAAVLVVSHHVVIRVVMAAALGLPVGQARKVSIDNCGVSVLTAEGGRLKAATVNAALHTRAA